MYIDKHAHINTPLKCWDLEIIFLHFTDRMSSYKNIYQNLGYIYFDTDLFQQSSPKGNRR